MKVRKRKGTLVITIPLLNPPKPSRSGKRLVVATSRGARRTGLKLGKKPIYVNANAYVRPDEQQDQRKHARATSSARRKRARKR